MIEVLSKEQKIFDIFLRLKNILCKADINTLWHVSAYIVRTNEEFDIEKDLQLSFLMQGEICKLSLIDGSEISFLTSSLDSDELDFIVEKYDSDAYMTIFVSTHEDNGLFKSFVYGTVEVDDWRYFVGIGDYEKGCCFVKVFHKDQSVEDSNSYFDVSLETNNDNGVNKCSGLVDIMERVNLLYKNVKSLKNNKLKRKSLL